MPRTKTEDRFWVKVEKADDCWPAVLSGRGELMIEKGTIEACVGAWLHNKRLADELVSDHDEALVERLHRELGTSHFREMIAENRRLMDEAYGPTPGGSR